MTQYIGKNEIKEKIEKRRGKNARNKLNLAAAFEDNYLLSFIDTLEVKEVDLEKEIEKVKKMYSCLELKEETIIDFCAKHFYELGLKAQKGE